jgi:hypothetical protein
MTAGADRRSNSGMTLRWSGFGHGCLKCAPSDDDDRNACGPEDDWDYEDFRLFLGPPERVEERKVTSVQRARDGGTTKISFQIEGAAAEAFISTPQNVNEPATLKHGGQTFTMAVTQGTAPAGLQFLCR